MIHKLSGFLKHWKRHRRFPRESYGSFRGVFGSFEEAAAAAPKTKPVGYDHPELAGWYVSQLTDELQEYDYPVLFHLKELLKDGATVFDFGGNAGIHYYRYRKHLDFGDAVEWTVCDLPEIIKAGKENAKAANLHFTEKSEDASGTDIFLASGSVQYIEDFAGMLGSLRNKPRHLLINRLPLYGGKQFVTLQNGGLAFYPQFVFNKVEFIASLQGIGYRLKDEWKDHLGGCFIPFHPKKCLKHYYGLYMKLAG